LTLLWDIEHFASYLLFIITKTHYFRSSKSQFQLTTIAHTLILKCSQCLKTVIYVVKLNKTHPLILAILFPFNVLYFTSILKTSFLQLFLKRGIYHRQIKSFWRRIEGLLFGIRSSGNIWSAIFDWPVWIIEIELILTIFSQNQGLVMRIKNFQIALHVIYLIFGSDSFINLFKFYESTCLIFHEDHSWNVSEIDENIVKTLMTVALRNGSDKNNFWRAIFY